MRQRLRDRLRRTWRSDIEPTEVLLVACAAYWSLILAWPADSFMTSWSYRAMDHIADELWWSGAAALLALLPVIALFAHRVWLRLLAALCHVGWWSFTSAMILISNPASTSWGIYALLAISAGWVVIRVSWDYGSELRAWLQGLLGRRSAR